MSWRDELRDALEERPDYKGMRNREIGVDDEDDIEESTRRGGDVNELLKEARYGLGGIFRMFRQRKRARRRRGRERGVWFLKSKPYGESVEEAAELESDVSRIGAYIRDQLETERPGVKVAWVGVDDVGPDDPEWEQAEDLAYDGHTVYIAAYTEPVYGRQFPEAFREGNYEVTALYVRESPPGHRHRRHPLHRYSS